MYDIYYAHHQWKYGTRIEKYEIDVIRRYFPNANIFNPATDLILGPDMSEQDVMDICLDVVRDSDILVFSSMDGCIGIGVDTEVREAEKEGKIILYLHHDKLDMTYEILSNDSDGRSDRVYSLVYGS